MLAQRPPGVIRAELDDFFVEEVPLYEFAGVGDHTLFRVEKRGLTTHQAVRDLARALGVSDREIGYAGLKDSRAVAQQWFSIEHILPERIEQLTIPRLTVLEISRHRNKLRLGHLKGNQFRIKVRPAGEPLERHMQRIQSELDRLQHAGMPNRFGEQRFGARFDTWKIGRALLRKDADEAIALMLGRPGSQDHGPVRRARELFDAGEFSAAAEAWPRMFHEERRVLRALAGSHGKARAALRALSPARRRLYLSAYQSHLFNQVLDQRMPLGLGRLLEGDLAWRHVGEAVFLVTDPEREQPRADTFEISPTGPIFGFRCSRPQAAPGEMEAAVLDTEGLTAEMFREPGLRLKGGRRPLRVQPVDPRVDALVDEHGPCLVLRFGLPSGAYATVLLNELFELQRGLDVDPVE